MVELTKIERICQKIANLWFMQSDLSLGQLLYVFTSFGNYNDIPFKTTDDELEIELDKAIEDTVLYKKYGVI